MLQLKQCVGWGCSQDSVAKSLLFSMERTLSHMPPHIRMFKTQPVSIHRYFDNWRFPSLHPPLPRPHLMNLLQVLFTLASSSSNCLPLQPCLPPPSSTSSPRGSLKLPKAVSLAPSGLCLLEGHTHSTEAPYTDAP